MNRKQLYSIY